MTHSWVLAILGAIAILNSPRHLAAFPGQQRPMSDRLGIGAVAVAFLLLVGMVVVLLAPAALDAIDVSAATAQMGVGLVVVVTAAVDLVRRLPDEIEGRSGPLAGLVPAGFPTLIRPEVLLTAAVVAASSSWSMAIVGLVAAGATVLAWTAMTRSGPRSVAARAIGTVLSAGAIGIGIELIVDGVYRL